MKKHTSYTHSQVNMTQRSRRKKCCCTLNLPSLFLFDLDPLSPLYWLLTGKFIPIEGYITGIHTYVLTVFES